MISIGDGVGTASVGDVLMVRWTAPATMPRAAWSWEQVQAHRKQNGDSVVIVYVILSSSSPPSSEVRARIVREFTSLGTDMRRFIVVPVGNALWESLVRTIVRAAMLLIGLSKHMTLCSSVKSATATVEEFKSSSTPPRAVLDEALVELQAQMDAASKGARV